MVIDEIDKELFDNSRMHFFFWFMRKIWIPLFLHKGGKRDFVRIDKDWSGNPPPKPKWRWVQIKEENRSNFD